MTRQEHQEANLESKRTSLEVEGSGQRQKGFELIIHSYLVCEKVIKVDETLTVKDLREFILKKNNTLAKEEVSRLDRLALFKLIQPFVVAFVSEELI